MALAGKATFNAAANVTQQALTSSLILLLGMLLQNQMLVQCNNRKFYKFSAPTNNVEGAFICLEKLQWFSHYCISTQYLNLQHQLHQHLLQQMVKLIY